MKKERKKTMKDRFKFRVWDKVFNIYWPYEDIKGNIAWLLFPDNDNINNVEIEQCTGLKDKNGKLIYDGDLVKLGEYGVCQVIWSDDTAEFMFKNLNEDLCEHVDTMLMYDWEVVGNIHKNKEVVEMKIQDLLKQAKPCWKYAAFDDYGWHLYTQKPKILGDQWRISTEYGQLVSQIFDIEPFDGDWKDSLICREEIRLCTY